MTAILGISAFYHDSAAALVVDGRIVAAAQEERFSRKKHDPDFPVRAIEYCLQEGGLEPAQLDYVGFYDKPLRKFDRLLETYMAYAPIGFRSFREAMPRWIQQKLHLPREMDRGLRGAFKKAYVFCEHHEAHAASAFFPSAFEEAAILTLDGVGEWATATHGYGRGNVISLTHELRFPHSLGLLYSAFTYYCGFTVNSGEYKLMGLAPYGQPRYASLIKERMVDLRPDGSFWMDMSYFNFCQGLTMTSRRFHDLLGGPPRMPDTPLTERDMDIAASIQQVTEEIVLHAARHVHSKTGMKNLCLAGGVALNCVANGHLLRDGPFDDIWVQPAAGDAGGALGVALLIWHQLLERPRIPQHRDSQQGSLLGPAFGDGQVRTFLDSVGAVYVRIDDEDRLCKHIADCIANGEVVGWFQGRMEYGPRALGSRSILGDPRSIRMQSVMNLKVKFREGFRPFAPAVLRERAHEYFEIGPGFDSPYMLFVAGVCQGKRRSLSSDDALARGIDKLHVNRSVIPAVTHVDFSARLQTVDADRHGLYRRLIEQFARQTGCPVVINTSFNLGWEPIVCSPADAYRTFMSSDIDTLCIGRFVLTKKDEQRAWARTTDYGCPPLPSSNVESPLGALRELGRTPCCGADFAAGEVPLRCTNCLGRFPVDGGIPLLFWPHESYGASADVTEAVRVFYEKTPFPNYDEHESVRSLIEKSRRGVYANLLSEAIPVNSTVLEVGCGTGQLANFLGIGGRRVVGTDLCLNSLRLAEAFRARHGLSRVRFIQMNLFRPCFREECFDVIICSGVLHHTSDPFGGFKQLTSLLAPGGYIIVGLYNKYGRWLTDVRRQFFRLTGGRFRGLDPHLRSQPMSESKRDAWFADQYAHPHESKHTVGEVLRWFSACGLQFIRGVPPLTCDAVPVQEEGLFVPTRPGGRLSHFVAQARQVFTGSREGGFFIMVAKKPGENRRAASTKLTR